MKINGTGEKLEERTAKKKLFYWILLLHLSDLTSAGGSREISYCKKVPQHLPKKYKRKSNVGKHFVLCSREFQNTLKCFKVLHSAPEYSRALKSPSECSRVHLSAPKCFWACRVLQSASECSKGFGACRVLQFLMCLREYIHNTYVSVNWLDSKLKVIFLKCSNVMKIRSSLFLNFRFLENTANLVRNCEAY